MSRRSRKRGSGGGASVWIKAAIAVLLLLVVTGGVMNLMVRRYLHSNEFRAFLSKQAGDAVRVEGEFKSLNWDGLAVDSEGFHGVGDKLIREVSVDGVRTEIGLGGFWDGFWEVQDFHVRRLELNLDARKGLPVAGGSSPAPVSQGEPAKSGRKWLPSEVELQGLEIGELVVKAMLGQGDVLLSGMQIRAGLEKERGGYQVDVLGGNLSLPYEKVPLIRIEDADLRYRDGGVFLNQLNAAVWEQGRLYMEGEFDPRHGNQAAQGGLSGVRCREVLPGNWLRRLSGELASDFEISSWNDEVRASGHLVLENGVLKALPVLDMLAAYADTERFRVLVLNKAEADWRWRNGEWQFTNIVITSGGLLRLEGDVTIRGERLNGRLRLGLAPGTLASIPGAEKDVFLAGEKGLRWAPIRLTGTLSDPQHDLGDRLIEAAGRRLIEFIPEVGGQVIRAGSDVIREGGDKVLEEGVKAVEEGVGILDRVLGGGQ